MIADIERESEAWMRKAVAERMRIEIARQESERLGRHVSPAEVFR